MERYFQLNNGKRIPSVGLGTWQTRDGRSVIQAVRDALESGYRHIDTAALYGNEKGIGKGIRESGVERGDIFVTSKVWNSERGYEKTLRAFEKTRNNLQLDYLDLYLIHWPATARQHSDWQQINAETWRAMEELQNAGKIRSIGVSNFMPHHLEPLMEGASVQPAVNQIEYHPGFMQEECVAFCKNHGMVVEAWAPLGTGKMLENDTLLSIARNYGKSVAQLCIRWVLQNGVLPLPKSSHPDRIRENLEVFDFDISQEDMGTINDLSYFGGSGLDPDHIDF